MAANAYPGTPLVEEFKGGDSHAILVQVKEAYEHDVARVREFVFDAAVAVGTALCSHDEPPGALATQLTLDQRAQAAKEHPGLCGVYHAAAIAGVSYADVAATAERRGVAVTFNVFRNQCCLDAAKKLGGLGWASNSLARSGLHKHAGLFFPAMARRSHGWKQHSPLKLRSSRNFLARKGWSLTCIKNNCSRISLCSWIRDAPDKPASLFVPRSWE